ncbi:ferredoxin [Vescimonas sp.]|uniref:ferredoxin n=1 Tax=Vescimonas sp. TaxID=2892404 RepID=UPI0030799B14
MKAMVYAKSCIQCGLCVSVCPEVFSLLPGQAAVARDTDIPTDLQLSVQAAAEGCPTDAISLQ